MLATPTAGRWQCSRLTLDRILTRLNASFTEAVQRDIKFGMGKAMTATVSRVSVYEALALAMFAGFVVFFVQTIVPLIAAD